MSCCQQARSSQRVHRVTLTVYTLQEAVDAEGRQRFHGAFTGGWSAGHYNSVGSAEGWAPAAFRSSRSDRASAKCVYCTVFLKL